MPWLRDQAVLSVLLATGLRVSELTSLDLDQYDGKQFEKVHRKGGRIQNIPVMRDARPALDDWIADRGKDKGPLFCTKRGERLDRVRIWRILKRITAQANSSLPSDEQIDSISPHVLRHTALRKTAEEKGVQYAKELSGHESDRYIWRYVRPSQQALADAMDDLEL